MNGTSFGSPPILQRTSTTFVRSSIFLFVSRQNAITRSGTIVRQNIYNEKSYEEKIPVGASRNSVLVQQRCGVELDP
uniref:Uncharacterized protein n=1 Tax=Caenorhabditis japonica TaxID=281687 RepID=A0A8R1EH18_CAEJA